MEPDTITPGCLLMLNYGYWGRHRGAEPTLFYYGEPKLQSNQKLNIKTSQGDFQVICKEKYIPFNKIKLYYWQSMWEDNIHIRYLILFEWMWELFKQLQFHIDWHISFILGYCKIFTVGTMTIAGLFNPIKLQMNNLWKFLFKSIDLKQMTAILDFKIFREFPAVQIHRQLLPHN